MNEHEKDEERPDASSPDPEAAASPSSDAQAPDQATSLADAATGQANIAPLPVAPFVVGIGASAGGLKALEAFFKHMPPDQGIAFLVAQHLDPSHESLMDRILSRVTTMRVVQVSHGERIEPNTIYVIPPGNDILARHGLIRLSKPAKGAGWPQSVNNLLRSLARDQGRNAVAVILSGTGSDGAEGVKAIKQSGGMVMVQDPGQAEYDGMPESAIATGLVDHILLAEDLPAVLLKHLAGRQPQAFPYAEEEEAPEKDAEALIHDILTLVKSRIGHDFCAYKPNTVRRRIKRRQVLLKLPSLADYLEYSQSNPNEAWELFKEMLIKVTGFFRDSDAFSFLGQYVLPDIITGKELNEEVRVWVPACATGEEAYSLAMLFMETMDRLDVRPGLRIFGTDINPAAIDMARLGFYGDKAVEGLTRERLGKYFDKIKDGYLLKPVIREKTVFAVQDIVRDPPFSRLDMISCRNMLIYMEPSLQKRVIPLLSYSLNPGGILFLGTSESILGMDDLFAVVSTKWRIFKAVDSKRKEARKRIVRAGHLTGPWEEGAFIMREHKKNEQETSGQNLPMALTAETELPPDSEEAKRKMEHLWRQEPREVVERELLAHTPPSVLTDESNSVLYFHGDTSPFLGLRGEPSLSILDMIHGALREKLTEALEAVRTSGQPQSWEEEQVSHRYGVSAVRVQVAPVGDKGMLLVSFEDKTPRDPGQFGNAEAHRRIQELEREIFSTKQDLKATIEELETANEELKSANEEQQANNEELQSANEELQTSREELQSINDALEGVNAELERKNEELTRANDDIRNLFVSTGVATLFLDQQLRITRFTPAATQFFSLRDQDMGRPVTEITNTLIHDALEKDLQTVLDTLVLRELGVRTKEGSWISLLIRPYRTSDNYIAGLVLTLTDVTALKEAEIKAHAARTFSENVVNAVPEPLLVLDRDLHIVSANRAFYAGFSMEPKELDGQYFYDIDNQLWNVSELRQSLQGVVTQGALIDDFRFEREAPGTGRLTMFLSARPLDMGDDQGRMALVILSDRAATHV